MYIQVNGPNNDILFVELPEKPSLSITQDDDSGAWMCCLILSTQVLVLKSGRHEECISCAKSLLDKIGLTPQKL